MRYLGFDALKMVLAITVVGVHAHLLVETSPVASFVVCDGVLRLAPPLFFMMSGHFLPRATETARVRHWLWSVVALYAVAMIAYAAVWAPGALANGPVLFIRYVLLGYWQLWFLSALAMAGFVLVKVRPSAHRGWIAAAVALYAVGCAIQYAAYYRPTGTTPAFFYRNAPFFGLPFMALGYHFDRIADVVHRYRYELLAAGMLLLGLEVRAAVHGPHPDRGFEMYVSMLLLAPALFEVVRSCSQRRTRLPLGKVSAAVYIIHPWFLMLGTRLGVAVGTSLFAFAAVTSVAASVLIVALLAGLAYLRPRRTGPGAPSARARSQETASS